MKKASLFILQAVTLISGPFFVGSAFASGLKKLEDQLLLQNPEIKKLESTLQAHEATVRAQRGSLLPEIYIAGGYEIKKTVHEPSEGYVGYIAGSWNLFKGGDDLYTSRILKTKSEANKLELEIKKRQLQRELRELYYTLLANKKKIILINEKAEALQKQRQMALKKISAGLSSNIDSLEIDLEENRIKSEKEIIESEILQTTQSLSALLNTDISVVQISENEVFDLNSDLVDPLEKIQETPALKKQVLLADISEITKAQKKSAFLPRVDLETRHGRLTGEYADPLKGAESQVSILLKWDLFSGFTSINESLTALHEHNAQIFENKNIQNEIKKDLQNLFLNKKNILKLIDYQKMRLQFTVKYYDLTLAEYKRGVKNSPDLQNATSSLFETKKNLIELEKDLSITNAKINELF